MLGTNLAKVSYYSTQHPFVNEFKSSKPWVAEGDREKTLLFRGDNYYPGGKYLVSYEGKGNIEYGLDAEKIENLSVLGKDVIELAPSDKGISISIPQGTSTLSSKGSSKIRNIEILPFSLKDRQGIFTAEFIEKLQPFDTIRFMDWMNTNHSTQKEWSDRPLVNDARYSEGVPVEIMVELANKTNTNPWFNMPHEASDEYIKKFAHYVKNHLNPNLDVYVEYSNEVWNNMFEQNEWVREQAVDNNSNLIDWYSQRTVEIIKIWDDVFNSSDSVIGVMASQAANVYRGEKLLEYRWNDEPLDHSDTGVDAIAIAPYFGNYIGKPENKDVLTGWAGDLDKGLDNLFDELTQGGLLSNSPEGGALKGAYRNIEAYSQLADENNLQLLAYEGGQHLVGSRGVENSEEITNLFIEASRDPRMGEIYEEYLDTWYELGGDTFVNFTDTRAHNKWGTWGALESVYQDSSPKYDALAENSQIA